MLRELNDAEMEEASGGIGPAGLVAGFVGGAVFEFVTNPDASIGDILLSGAISGAATATGGLLLAGTTASRVSKLNRIRNVGLTDDIIETGAGAILGAGLGVVDNVRRGRGVVSGFGFGGGGGGNRIRTGTVSIEDIPTESEED